MPKIPQQFIEELLSRADIVELIDKRVPLKKQGREFAACCPFHNEKSPSFFVSPVKQFYHCFGCGAHGTAISFLMEYDHMAFPEAVRELAEMMGMQVPVEQGETASVSSNAPLYEVLDKAASYYRTQLKTSRVAIEYLKSRGLTGEIAKEFNLGFVPPGWDNVLKAVGRDDAAVKALQGAGMLIEKENNRRFHDRFRERVMFPIKDDRGRVIGFGGRVIGQGEPKYLNSPETSLFHKGRNLYGLYEAKQALRSIPRLLVVEGYMDVVALAQYGVRYAVATLGTSTTTEHVIKLFKIVNEVVFCFDGDRAGRSAAWRAMENALPAAESGRQISFLFLPEGEDPDTLIRKEGKEAFEKRLSSATPLSKFMLDTLTADADYSSSEGRAALVAKLVPYLALIRNGTYRMGIIEDVARLTGRRSEELTTIVNAVAKGGAGPSPIAIRPALNTPARKAIAYILYRPALSLLVNDLGSLINDPSLAMLRELLEFTQAHPHINGAAVLEHWRDTEIGTHLDKLAQAEIVTPDEALETEFKAVMSDLTGRRPTEQRRDQLIAESGKRDLNSAEKAELAQLLAVSPRKPRADSAKSD